MSTNLTEEIRSVEAAAAQQVADARAQAQDIVAKARAAASAKVKEAKQSQFRDYRRAIREVEAEAEKTSAATVEKGRTDALEFVQARGEAVKKTAQWLAEEVVSRYGRC